MSLLRAAATVSSLTLLSRITGLARDILIARAFGAGALTDAFWVALEFLTFCVDFLQKGPSLKLLYRFWVKCGTSTSPRQLKPCWIAWQSLCF